MGYGKNNATAIRTLALERCVVGEERQYLFPIYMRDP
jgi:hypothetical protein